METVLTIAGFDPSSGAGISADLLVIAAHGLFGTASVTALTVQSTLGVKATHPVQAGLVAETLCVLDADLPARGIKIGMLANREIVCAVADFLGAREARRPVVLDPVVRSSSGRELLDGSGLDALRERLLPLVHWVTPNLAELEALTGLPVRNAEEMERAGASLRDRFPGLGVVVTGGHLEPPDDLVLLPEGGLEWIRGVRIASRATHGTGCAFSTALLCGLVRGEHALQAARHAKYFVREAIERAEPLGGGRCPMNLLWPLKPRPT